MQRTFAPRAASMKRAKQGTIAWTGDTSRPSRCMAPPSAQKLSCTSTEAEGGGQGTEGASEG